MTIAPGLSRGGSRCLAGARIEKGYEMNTEQARALVGNQSTDALRNMVKALSLPVSAWLNTPADIERLAAAKYLLRQRSGANK